jgi:hypothetical protein
MNCQKPAFWKTTLNDIKEVSATLQVGTKSIMCCSAGGREIMLFSYGQKQDMGRQANYNSACGARDPSHYANKDREKGIKPVVLIIGGIHGGELQGIAAILNLVRVFETGRDHRNRNWEYLYKTRSEIRFLLIPCLNPDGRLRIPFDTSAGIEKKQYSYYEQGTWKDGTLCGWPACKAIHPILDSVEHLGGYYNDDGVNLMHDNFFAPMAEETRSLMKLVDSEAPDFIIQLHGGGNIEDILLYPAYAPLYVKKKVREFDRQLLNSFKEKGLGYQIKENSFEDGCSYPPPSFNLTSALHHICGGVSVLYESNSALSEDGVVFSHDEILDHHMVLFEEILKFHL